MPAFRRPLNTSLEVGSLTETVEVSARRRNSANRQRATVTSTLVGRQLHELPFTSRNLTELIVTQPGSATPGVPRSTSVYGLPQSALNVTLDGINIQDNSNKSERRLLQRDLPARRLHRGDDRHLAPRPAPIATPKAPCRSRWSPAADPTPGTADCSNSTATSRSTPTTTSTT